MDLVHIIQANFTKATDQVTLWHRRMGHTPYYKIYEMAKKYPEMKILKRAKDLPVCGPCRMGKSKVNNHKTRKAGDRSLFDSTNPREILALDLKGPFEVRSIGGALFWLIAIDKHTKHINMYFLKQKSFAIEKVKELYKEVEREGNKIRIIRTDGGGEFVGKEFKEFLERK